ncbi:hexokinase [Opitutaceae bacterium EW11]|nr:hexokinase [Opitutaceae bacterium EW11]
MTLSSSLEQLRAELSLDLSQLDVIALDFERAMAAGLRGQSSSLKMLPSFLGLPTGDEKGDVLAIDFGGTNLRVMAARLDGSRGATIAAVDRFPLVDAKAGYNLIGASAQGAELFDAIARRLAKIAPDDGSLPLGFTFSFPCEQTAVMRASLLHWTKEIQTQGVVGQDVGNLLVTALKRNGLTRVEPRVILNDTVGTLIAAAYDAGGVDIGAICGTGHNACYLEPKHPLTGAPMIVNIESGNFDGVAQTRFDAQLDRTSVNPGGQRLEKMVSGKYLGEILRLVLVEWTEKGFLPKSPRLHETNVVSGAVLDQILLDHGDHAAIDRIAREKLQMTGLDAEQRRAVQAVMRLLADRSARLASASFVGIVRHTDPKLQAVHGVAIDGSLYEKMPGYAAELQRTLEGMLPKAEHPVATRLAKDGSGIGAAIAARVAKG